MSNHGWIDTYKKGHNCEYWECPTGCEFCSKFNKPITACGKEGHEDNKKVDCFVCKDYEEDFDYGN